MRNVLVVGGAGFIGSHLCERLLATPGVEHVVVFDNFSSGKWAYVPTYDKRVRVVPGSIGDDRLRNAMLGCDTVFHLAANPDISKAVTDPTIDFWQGTHLTQCVLEAMRLTCAKRLFYTSGSGVYGDYHNVPVQEFLACQPISTYGASKLASEALISSYVHMFGLTASVFRFANVVGPRQTHGVGYDFIRKLKKDPTRLEILGDGKQSKSYIHVEDVLNAMFTVAEKQTANFDVWNVATYDCITVEEIAHAVAWHFKIIGTHEILKFGTADRGWKGDVPVVKFDCSKIRSLGWEPKMNSIEAMHAAVTAMLHEINGTLPTCGPCA